MAGRLLDVINSSLHTGTFPDKWKMSLILIVNIIVHHQSGFREKHSCKNVFWTGQ